MTDHRKPTSSSTREGEVDKRAPSGGAAVATGEEWRVTLQGPRLELVRLERMRNGPGETKEFVLSIDTSSGACNNIEVVDDGARRPLTTEEYTHLASVYMAAYTSAAYGQHDETWADYWRAYFASIATPTR